MGVCQSVGGASTSGQGLTGSQVAQALKVAATSHQRATREPLDDDADFGSDSYRSPASLRSKQNPDASRSIVTLNDLAEEAFSEKVTHKQRSRGAVIKVLTVTEYCPKVFRFLRSAGTVDETQFFNEWELPEHREKMKMGDGRSMAMFLHSRTHKFMCKTISAGEVDVLMGILRDYVHHVSSFPDTLLLRFHMLLRIQVGGVVGYLLCFENVFPPKSRVTQKWDVKGRVAKRKNVEAEPSGAAEESVHNADWSARVNGADPAAVSDSTSVAERPAVKTQREQDLKRVFYLSDETARHLLNQLNSDYAFLRGHGLMDYSLLIGLSHTTNFADYDAKAAGSMFANGILTRDGTETIYVGVVDILTSYTLKKKTANFFKSFLWKEKMLSTISPEKYYDRILPFSQRLFKKIDL